MCPRKKSHQSCIPVTVQEAFPRVHSWPRQVPISLDLPMYIGCFDRRAQGYRGLRSMAQQHQDIWARNHRWITFFQKCLARILGPGNSFSDGVYAVAQLCMAQTSVWVSTEYTSFRLDFYYIVTLGSVVSSQTTSSSFLSGYAQRRIHEPIFVSTNLYGNKRTNEGDLRLVLGGGCPS